MFRAITTLAALALLASCQTSGPFDDIVSQTYVHKYGFETSAAEWEARERDGQVVSTLKNGVTVTRTYENGKLHGQTTYTFPHSSVLERVFVYDQGTLLKERLNDISGMPIREEIYEYDNRNVITLWDEKGVPLSIEEYHGEQLEEGKYYTPDHELEALVQMGHGERIKRDRQGQLISKDDIDNGLMVCRTTYHPNGRIHTISHYDKYQLHGKQTKFTANGKPLMELNWHRGVLDGEKVVYRNGYKIAVIPYVMGKKTGTEFHYDDLGTLTAEIDWRDDKKHGTTKQHTEGYTDTEWFFKGQSVNADRFQVLDQREQIMNEFNEASIQ